VNVGLAVAESEEEEDSDDYDEDDEEEDDEAMEEFMNILLEGLVDLDSMPRNGESLDDRSGHPPSSMCGARDECLSSLIRLKGTGP
jgi:hypothetical protein